ncbi:hypothetical protein BH11PLA2_BH11PLA2_26360 [soil metagenome]
MDNSESSKNNDPVGGTDAGCKAPRMQFAYLTFPEVERAAIRWDEMAPKSSDLVAAALAAGFSELEVRESAVGVLEWDWVIGDDWVFKAGSRALIGMNGSMLIEMS